MDFDHSQCRTCSTSLPGGNLVDGLPPVAHTRAGYRDARLGRNICGVNGRLGADFSRFLYLFWAAPEN